MHGGSHRLSVWTLPAAASAPKGRRRPATNSGRSASSCRCRARRCSPSRPKFTARNGGVTLNNVGGDLRGETTNGGVTIDLRGDHWDGAGLDVETRNGGIRMTMPANYSAQLETGTTNGRINVDFPITVQGALGRQLTTILGAGGARIRAITTNGGVSIRRQ
ncbi:MAG: hypothetical protein DMG01_04450 [Acidobacteria bacterium]|nr:MAG: hypothetical protein DMG01_04450 [Acidobacteriota bacterium]